MSHDHSEIILIWWFASQETFLLIIIFLISVRVKQHLFEIDFFNNNNVNVFAVTFDQFKFLILNLNKKNTNPKLLNISAYNKILNVFILFIYV